MTKITSDNPDRARRLEALFRRLADRSRPPAIMGILNVTPDSFSDGGQFADHDSALRQALAMLDEGADVIDIGAESTRPGSDPVAPQEQLRRAIPVLQSLRQHAPSATISIDTQDAAVAEAAALAGADVVNDVSALRGDARMAGVIAEHGASVVLMHMRGTPKTMQTAGGGPAYGDVVKEVGSFLRERVAFAVAQRIDPARILIDPGIGFGKTVEHNLELMRRLEEIGTLGLPVLVGASRKTFLAALCPAPSAADRLGGSLAAALWAASHGAAMVRVHDVLPTCQALTVLHAIAK